MKYSDNKELKIESIYVFEYPDASYMGVLASKTSRWHFKECILNTFINLNSGYRGYECDLYSYNSVREPSLEELAYYKEIRDKNSTMPFKDYKSKVNYDIY